jgi:hypothetical protein
LKHGCPQRCQLEPRVFDAKKTGERMEVRGGRLASPKKRLLSLLRTPGASPWRDDPQRGLRLSWLGASLWKMLEVIATGCSSTTLRPRTGSDWPSSRLHASPSLYTDRTDANKVPDPTNIYVSCGRMDRSNHLNEIQHLIGLRAAPSDSQEHTQYRYSGWTDKAA